MIFVRLLNRDFIRKIGGDFINEIILTVILTLLIHSLIGTIVYMVTNESDEFITYYGLGVVGCLLSGILYIIRIIKKWWFCHDKRSIFVDDNGNRFYCEVKYVNDFWWHYGKIIKRYATKDEWKNLTPVTKEQIKEAQRNCDRCKYNGKCTFDYIASFDNIRCKHDVFGTVTEFDRFERK